eukprot:8853-Pelagomonas_calceolata.AAC.5
MTCAMKERREGISMKTPTVSQQQGKIPLASLRKHTTAYTCELANLATESLHRQMPSCTKADSLHNSYLWRSKSSFKSQHLWR